MARPFARKFYNSKQWIKCRNTYRESKYHICERCQGVGEEVHHKAWLTPDNINDPEITLSFENLELLCSSCHNKEHMSKHSPLRDDVIFNSNGELIQVESHSQNNDV